MPQRQQISWAQLRVGTMVIVSLAILAVGIFFISGQAGFLSRKYTLRTYFSNASGLRQGAAVRIAGIPVGNVTEIKISDSAEPRRAVEVGMRVPIKFRDQIRGDSQAKLTTAGLLGDAFVDISRGHAEHPVVPDGGEVGSVEEPDIREIVQNTNDVISNLRVLSGKLNEIIVQIQAGKGSIGKLIYDEDLYANLEHATGSLDKVVSRIERGEGTVGKLMTDETIHQRTVATLDRIEKILDDAEHGSGTLPKLLHDPSIYNNVDQLVARANSLMDNVNKGQGTLGKLVADPTLYNRVNETMDRLNVITARIEQGQGTLGKLSTDPTLFNNLNESSNTLRDFLAEFKKNPKKYLTVRVRLF